MLNAGLILFIRCQLLTKNLFQRVYGYSLPTSVFDRVVVLREMLCVRNGYCSQALLSSDKCIFCSVCISAVNVYTFSSFFTIVYYCTIHIK